jgi:hypothetical protein
MFLNFLSQKVTNFCSKKTNLKKNILGKSLKKTKYFGIFVPKKYFWCSLIIAPLVKTSNFSFKGGGAIIRQIRVLHKFTHEYQTNKILVHKVRFFLNFAKLVLVSNQSKLFLNYRHDFIEK